MELTDEERQMCCKLAYDEHVCPRPTAAQMRSGRPHPPVRAQLERIRRGPPWRWRQYEIRLTPDARRPVVCPWSRQHKVPTHIEVGERWIQARRNLAELYRRQADSPVRVLKRFAELRRMVRFRFKHGVPWQMVIDWLYEQGDPAAEHVKEDCLFADKTGLQDHSFVSMWLPFGMNHDEAEKLEAIREKLLRRPEET